MDYTECKAILSTKLTKERYNHSLSVSSTAERLAKRFGVSSEKAKLAGLLHDCARTFQIKDLVEVAEKMQIPVGEIERHAPILLHANIGAELIDSQYEICDEEIKQAIRLHTTGGKNMTNLDKIVYLADLIEPNRDFNGVDNLRELAVKNLDQALFEAFNQSIMHVIKLNQVVHPYTIVARNEMLLKE